jgi:hypothetical protein
MMVMIKVGDKLVYRGAGIRPDFSYVVGRRYTVYSLERVDGDSVDAMRSMENHCWQYLKYFTRSNYCKYACCDDEKKVCPFREKIE